MRRLMLCGLLALSACASKAEDISPSYVSPIAYDNLSCAQLAQEGKRVSAAASRAAGVQDKNRSSDKMLTTVGDVLFWPVLLGLEGDGANAAELANLKGQMNAIQEAANKKKCDIQFRQG